MPALAAELVSRPVDVLVAVGGDPSAIAAKAATSTIPIVFSSGNPIKSGLVASMNRPGGNATGVHIVLTELEPKKLSLLHELFPGAALFGALMNPEIPTAGEQTLEFTEAARKLGRPIVVLNARNDAEIDAAFASMAQQHAVAMMVLGAPFFDTRRAHIIALAANRNCPPSTRFANMQWMAG